MVGSLRMTIVRLKGVKRYRSGGKVYHYHRATGARLPDDPLAMMRRLAELEGANPPRPSTSAPGTFADLVDHYLRAPEFTRLAPETRASYRKRIDWLREKAGNRRVATITRETVLELRDRFKDRPRQADWMVQVLRRLLSYAIDRPSRYGLTTNPAARPGRLWRPSQDANRAWSEAEMAAILRASPPAVALAVTLGAYTGQRLGDVLRMTWRAYDGARITLRQQKTGELVTVPAHADLRAKLDAAPRIAVTIIAGRRGRPLTVSGFQTLFQRARAKAGIARGLTFHGLRHTVAERLLEAGATREEVGALLGHRTLVMVDHYTRRARQTRLAEAAVARMKGAGDV